MNAFVEKFSKAKLNPEAMLPCYGMAEATLAMSFVGKVDKIKVDTIDADACYEEKRAIPFKSTSSTGTGSLELVSCGKPFPRHELGIFDPQTARRLGEREIGEIWFRGPSVAAGYFRNAEATAASFRADGWLRTGDLGYQADGEIYISGRQKDILIIHGRNYYPQGIEWLCEEIPGVRKGNVVAFSIPGPDSEEVVIVAETNETDPEKRQTIATAVKAHLVKEMQLGAHDVVLLGVGELPKTTSGKLQRRKTREQYLARTLGTEGVRSMGATGERLALARHFMMSLVSRVSHRAANIWPWWPVSMVTRRKNTRMES
jgi:acyl-CoA synthetase (AMP-forming)/AMP-acid ligase II